MPRRALQAALILSPCFVALPAAAETYSDPVFSGSLSVGGEYDSNVAIDELDITASQSDYAITGEFDIEVSQELTERLELDVSYDYSQSLYREFSEVDRQSHMLGSNLSYKLDSFRAGASMYYVHARLDKKPFLDLFRFSPFISGFIGKKWFSRAAYLYSEKSIESSNERDATTHAGEGEMYYFVTGLRSYFNMGYRYKDENAVADQFSYTSHGFKMRYVHRTDIMGVLTKFQLSWRMEDRNYRAIEPDIGEKRDDTRQRWQLDIEIPLWENSSLELYGGYGDYDSNLPRADYTQGVTGLNFVYSW